MRKALGHGSESVRIRGVVFITLGVDVRRSILMSTPKVVKESACRNQTALKR